MRNVLRIMLGMFTMLFLMGTNECSNSAPAQSDSGVKKVTVEVQTQASGLTIEQENVQRRLMEDNIPGSIKHLYVISPMSGQALIYSTVKGKVTSSSKRLTPISVESAGEGRDGFDLRIGNWSGSTLEVLQDDGTYGSSVPYIFWWDVRDIYHQHFFTGGQIIHLSSQPMPLVDIVINIEAMYEDTQ